MSLAYWKLKAVAFFVLSAWAGGMAAGAAIADDDEPALRMNPGATVPPTEARALELYNAHDCWRDQAPADLRGQVPGHVVVTTRHNKTVYGGPRLVSQALDQRFADKPTGLTIWAFCR